MTLNKTVIIFEPTPTGNLNDIFNVAKQLEVLDIEATGVSGKGVWQQQAMDLAGIHPRVARSSQSQGS